MPGQGPGRREGPLTTGAPDGCTVTLEHMLRVMSDQRPPTCPAGHNGPFLYVEAIEVWRDVLSFSQDKIVIAAPWQTGEGYDDGLPGSGYLLCVAEAEHGHCNQKVPLQEGVQLYFE